MISHMCKIVGPGLSADVHTAIPARALSRSDDGRRSREAEAGLRVPLLRRERARGLRAHREGHGRSHSHLHGVRRSGRHGWSTDHLEGSHHDDGRSCDRRSDRRNARRSGRRHDGRDSHHEDGRRACRTHDPGMILVSKRGDSEAALNLRRIGRGSRHAEDGRLE